MPTVSQLPTAITVDDDDLLMLVQGGLSVAASTGLLLAGTQPALTLAQGALLGRVSASPGGPEAVVLGSGLALSPGATHEIRRPFDGWPGAGLVLHCLMIEDNSFCMKGWTVGIGEIARSVKWC